MLNNLKREITNRGEINILSGSCLKFLKPIRFSDDSSCGSDLHDDDDDDDDDDGSTQRKEKKQEQVEAKIRTAVWCRVSVISHLIHCLAELHKRPESHLVCYSVVIRSSFPGEKTAGCEADLSPPRNAEVNAWGCIFSLHGVRMNSFAFYVKLVKVLYRNM
jgi:hypothetical protein